MLPAPVNVASIEWPAWLPVPWVSLSFPPVTVSSPVLGLFVMWSVAVPVPLRVPLLVHSVTFLAAAVMVPLRAVVGLIVYVAAPCPIPCRN